MNVPLIVRIRALLARDGKRFWYDYYTDEERELRDMDVMQLAAALHEAQEQRNNQRRIVIEFMLSVRLAKLQAKASWGAGALGFAGAVLGAGITAALTTSSNPTPEPKLTVSCECSANPKADSSRSLTGAAPASSSADPSTPPATRK